MIKGKYVEDISSIKDLLVIDGKKCKTTDDLFKEYATVLKFPDYFGYNWGAFDECIRDFDFPEYDGKDDIYIFVKNIDDVLTKEKFEIDKYIYTTTFTNFDDKVNFGEEWDKNIYFVFDRHTLMFLRKEIIKNFKIDRHYKDFFSDVYWNDDIGKKIFISEKFIEEIKNSPNANILYFIFFTYSWCFDFEGHSFRIIENAVYNILKKNKYE